MTRILIFTPTYDNRLQARTLESIAALKFDGELNHVISDENPYPGRDMRNCVFQFRKGRQIAIDDNYDGLLLIEHDMIVPKHTVQRLWDTRAPVVYGTYELRHRMFAVNLFQYVGDQNIGMSLSLYPRELRDGRRKGWLRVSGAGFGCLLIKRQVFAKIPFQDNGNAPDLPFAHDCMRQKILCIGRTDVECGHIDIDNDVVLWPFEGNEGMLARVLMLQDVVINDRGQSKRLTPGKYASLSLDVARELQRAGYVKITNEADVVADEISARETATDKTMSTRETATAPQTDLADQTVAELRTIAVASGVDLSGITRKADIIAAIKSAEEA